MTSSSFRFTVRTYSTAWKGQASHFASGEIIDTTVNAGMVFRRQSVLINWARFEITGD